MLLGSVIGASVAMAALATAAAFGATSGARASSASAPAITGQFAAIANPSLPAPPASIVADFASIHAGITDVRQVGNNAFAGNYNGAICVEFMPGPGGCTNHLDHGVWLLGDMIRAWDSEQAPFNVNLYGVAEDGVSSLSVALSDGTTRTIAVLNNAFQATFDDTTFSEITGVTVNSGTGQSALDPQQYFPTSLPTPNP